MIKISNRFDEHVADYSKDFLKIKDLAMKEKQLSTIQKWMNEKIEETKEAFRLYDEDTETEPTLPQIAW